MITYVNTTPSTIVLDFRRDVDANFVGTTAFTGAKTISLRDNTDAEVFTFTFSITTSAALTFPASFIMDSTDSRWVAATNILTLTGTGKYNVSALFDGTNWILKASQDGGLV